MSTATLEPPPLAAAPGSSPEIPWITTEQVRELLEEEGTDREIIDGRLIEYPKDDVMSRRTRSHSRLVIRVGHLLSTWLDQQPEPRGELLGGEAAFRLHRDPDTTVGVDVAYISPAQRSEAEPDAAVLEGAPVLAVEIYSPSDQHQRVMTKVRRYLEAGSALVWLIDPEFRTITVHRPDAGTKIFNENDDLTAEPHLPGFRVPLKDIFA